MHLAFMLIHTVHQSLIRNGLGGKVSVKKQLLKKKKTKLKAKQGGMSDCTKRTENQWDQAR